MSQSTDVNSMAMAYAYQIHNSLTFLKLYIAGPSFIAAKKMIFVLLLIKSGQMTNSLHLKMINKEQET